LSCEVFPEATCQAVFQATGGVPRLVNQVCDHALLLAYVAGRRIIEPASVEEAWADLQQLPTQYSGEAKSDVANSGVIEFGSLDDSPEATDGTPNASATSARVFRVASVEDDEEAETGDFEPSDQIHRIEELLAKADDDFQPAGSIGPEIELHFEDAPHPFQEEFEHEEVVSDRYATKAAPVKSGDESSHSKAPPVPERLPEVVPLQEESVEDASSLRDQPAPKKVPPIAPPQRHEYRHLFAQLLRG
jgi:hypothetical protein